MGALPSAISSSRSKHLCRQPAILAQAGSGGHSNEREFPILIERTDRCTRLQKLNFAPPNQAESSCHVIIFQCLIGKSRVVFVFSA